MKGLTPFERPPATLHPDRLVNPLRAETVGLAVNTKLRYRFTYDPAARRVILFWLLCLQFGIDFTTAKNRE